VFEKFSNCRRHVIRTDATFYDSEPTRDLSPVIARYNRDHTARSCNTITKPLYSPTGFLHARQPVLVHKLARILSEARSPKPIPFFRRRDIEALFGLKKRQAVNLMHRIGAIRVSRELAVDKRDLIAWLEQMLENPSVSIEQRRHERVIDRIVELKAETAARAIKIVLPEPKQTVQLPEGVSLEPGLLTISFDNEQQLLERLFLLARVLATQPHVLSAASRPR
jgi:hypothetical protein